MASASRIRGSWGQPWRIRHLDEVLGHIAAHQGVWKATGGEIIDWFRAQSGQG